MRTRGESVETPRSWLVAVTAVTMLALAQGGPLIVVVGLKPIADDLGQGLSLPSLASALGFLGSGVGGVLCGWLAGRIGIRLVAMLGGAMLAAGLALASLGSAWALLVGVAVGVGMFGTGALFAPMFTHVSMWFDRRRGSALALMASGQYIAGALWPPLFDRAIAAHGWQRTMLGFGVLAAAVMIPLAAVVLRPAPIASPGSRTLAEPQVGQKVLGLPPNVALALIAAASFLCCIPMAMPAAHLVAFCTDRGFSNATGAYMLSVMLLAAFVSRQVWGAISDRIGGLPTVFIGNIAQTLAMIGFVQVSDEAGLFAVAGAYGLGFGGITPAYVLAVRGLFPAAEAHWRVPAQLLASLSGMAFGTWLAGAIHDRVGFYAPAWWLGIVVNVVQLVLVGWLLWRQFFPRGLRHA
jgi:MFS family permease